VSDGWVSTLPRTAPPAGDAVVATPVRPARRRLRSGALRVAGPALGSFLGVETTAPVAALTYDDGPDPAATPGLLDVLRGAGVRATFFVLADQVDAYPDLARALVAEGHEVALHGEDHRHLATLSPREVVATITRAKRRVEAVVGSRLRLYRPPFGYQNPVSYAVTRSLGMAVVGWTADGDDWLDLPPADVASRVLDELAPGGIVLLHDRCAPLPGQGTAPMAAGLDRPAVLRALLAASGPHWRFGTVTALRDAGRPVVRPWFEG
jgi:peptidoglycan/xylan/chitin deacetylase (PgdA/CDA1 family)